MNTPVTVIQFFETTNQDPLAELRTPQLQELQGGWKQFMYYRCQNVIPENGLSWMI